MIRHSLSSLVIVGLVLMNRGYAQSEHHDDVEIIDAPAFHSTNEKKPDLTAVVNNIIEKTNAFRQQEHRSPVGKNAKLSKTAQYFADYMARTGRYGHTADKQTPAERATKHEYDYCIVLENIAYAFNSEGFSTDELTHQFVDGWKKSPGHRRNMLDADVVDTGVAVARSEKTGYYFAVQMFGRPKSMAIKFRIDNQTSTTVHYGIGKEDFSLPAHYTRSHERCRPTEIAFEIPSDGKTRKRTEKVKSGDRFVITKGHGSLHVKKE